MNASTSILKPAILKQTPSQTVGPYFAYGLTAAQYHYPQTQIAGSRLFTGKIKGEVIKISGRVFDGAGDPVDDALIEIWQANADGRLNHTLDQRENRRLDKNFIGFGRCGTGTSTDLSYHFITIKPGAVRENDAPFISVIVFMRGLLSHAYTRLYFADEVAANERDPVLNQVPPARRHTLIAPRLETATGAEYRFDIYMQGERETVFFEI